MVGPLPSSMGVFLQEENLGMCSPGRAEMQLRGDCHRPRVTKVNEHKNSWMVILRIVENHEMFTDISNRKSMAFFFVVE